MLNVQQVLSEVSRMRMQAEAMVLTLKSLELGIVETMKADRKPVGPVGAFPEATKDCTCPPNQRVVISRVGEPGKTQCRICEKEHAS